MNKQPFSLGSGYDKVLLIAVVLGVVLALLFFVVLPSLQPAVKQPTQLPATLATITTSQGGQNLTGQPNATTNNNIVRPPTNSEVVVVPSAIPANIPNGELTAEQQTMVGSPEMIIPFDPQILVPTPSGNADQGNTPINSSALPIELVALTSPVTPGTEVVLTIHTVPGANVMATASYLLAENIYAAEDLPNQTADQDGLLTWQWFVPSNLQTGEHILRISAAWNGQTNFIDTVLIVP